MPGLSLVGSRYVTARVSFCGRGSRSLTLNPALTEMGLDEVGGRWDGKARGRVGGVQSEAAATSDGGSDLAIGQVGSNAYGLAS